MKRRGRPPGSRNKNTLTKEAATGPATSVKPATTHAAGDRAVVAQKRKRVEYECDVVTFLRRGGISILEALAVKLPDVFAAEILPKLDMTDTLNLAQVNKAYNDTVWSVEGVRSMTAKIEAHLVKIGKKTWTIKPIFWAAEHGNVPAVRACLESGVDVNKVLSEDNHSTALLIAAIQGHTHVVMELIKAGADVNQAISTGVTPLYAAARNGHDGIVALLIQAGADVRKACKGGYTPMKIATINQREKVVTLLKFYERV